MISKHIKVLSVASNRIFTFQTKQLSEKIPLFYNALDFY